MISEITLFCALIEVKAQFFCVLLNLCEEEIIHRRGQNVSETFKII